MRYRQIRPGTGIAQRALGLDAEASYTRATSFVPSRRPAYASEISEVIAWLLSDKASYITGAVIDVNGGYRMQ